MVRTKAPCKGSRPDGSDCPRFTNNPDGLCSWPGHRKPRSEPAAQSEEAHGPFTGEADGLPDNYMVIDFEASGIVADSSDWEIVEFPAVMVDSRRQRMSGKVFHRYVRPTRNPALSDACKTNCGIEQSWVDAAAPIHEVVRALEAWAAANVCGSVAVVTCADYDPGTALRAEAERKGFELPLWLRQWVNIKVPFEAVHGSRPGMKGMLQTLGLSLDGRHHCGLDDARNIAKIVVALLKRGVPLRITKGYEPGARAVSREQEPQPRAAAEGARREAPQRSEGEGGGGGGGGSGGGDGGGDGVGEGAKGGAEAAGAAKRAKKIRKALREIEELRAAVRAGADLEKNQQEKIGRGAALREELTRLEREG